MWDSYELNKETLTKNSAHLFFLKRHFNKSHFLLRVQCGRIISTCSQEQKKLKGQTNSYFD